MHKRPSLSEAKALLNQHAPEIMKEYETMKITHGEFFAARYIVDIVDHYNHITTTAQVKNL
tara:strand:- start:101 stop:283 length:183 start_codon:yes stop_codon:yes gene_type:complete